METLMLYFLKVNGLIIAFYVMYWLFLKNETFFMSNRWYLILGLVSSFILPFITFTRTIWIEPKPIEFTQFTSYASVVNHAAVTETQLNWSEILLALYLLVVLLIMIKIGFEIISFYRNIKNQHRIKESNFTLIHTSKSDNPFSFFNYIVLNQKQFSEEELNHIIIHESIHVKQKHSIDVLFSRMICALLWINPVIWFYRKAIIQNLEYIADSETFRTINNKQAYQKTLLKVVVNQNQLAVTNQFFQSLIKKRIVMLQTNPSSKMKLWKYTFILPFLVVFTLLFQIETIAQVNKSESKMNFETSSVSFSSILSKDATDEDLKDLEKVFTNERHHLIISNVKRNKKQEIVGIKLVFTFGKPYMRILERISDKPISNIKIYTFSDEKNELVCGFEELETENNKDVDIQQKYIAKPASWTLESMKKNGKDVVMIINGKYIVPEAKVEFSPDEEIGEMKEISAIEFERKYNQKADNNKRYYEINTLKSNKESTADNASKSNNVKALLTYNMIDPASNSNTTNSQIKEVKSSLSQLSYEIYKPEKNLETLTDDKSVNYKKALILLNGKEISSTEAEQLDPLTISRGIVITGSEKTKKAYGEKALNGVILIDTYEKLEKTNAAEKAKYEEVDFNINVKTYGFIISKDSEKEDLDFYKSTLAKNNIDLKISGIKRNNLGEITSLNIQLKQGSTKIQKNIKTDYPIQSIYVGKRNGKIVIEEKK